MTKWSHSSLQVAEWIPDFWKPRQDFLFTRGYELVEPQSCWPRKFVECPKTHQDTAQSFILIAKCRRDNERVMIERLGTTSQSYVVQTTLPKDWRNRCVPVRECFPDPLEPDVWSYIVTPVRERRISSSLQRVNHVVVLLDHVLEGLVFLHQQGITRCRNCISWQISSDSRHWPEEDHKWWHLRRRHHPSEPSFFFDSICHPLGEVHEDTREDPHPRHEHQYEHRYFQDDVATLAKIIKESTCLRVSNIDFVVPLLRAMFKHDVNAAGALEMWQEIRRKLSHQEVNKTLEYWSRLCPENDHPVREERPDESAQSRR